MSATRRCSPGRMRSPASSARSNLVDIPLKRLHGGARPRPARSENPAEGGVAVEDGDGAFLETLGAAEADVGGEDPPQHDFGPQLGAEARVELEVLQGR